MHRSIIKQVSALLLIVSLCFYTSACKADISKVISAVKQAIPLLQAVGVDIGPAQQVIDLANQFDADPKAATLSALTIAFDRVVAQAQGIQEQGRRTVVLVILVVANIALTNLAEKYLEQQEENPDDPRLGAPPVRATIRKFATKKRWNCRASGPVERWKAGQYMPMEMCKKYPDNSVVEAY